MLKNIEELKDLILFAKANKVKSLEISGIKVEISELAHIEQAPGMEMGSSQNPSIAASMTSMLDDMKSDEMEDEDLLFHSSRP